MAALNEDAAMRRWLKGHPHGTREAALRAYETTLRTSREAKERRKQPCIRGCGNQVSYDSRSGVCQACVTSEIAPPHGTRSRYNRGCRCDECHAACAVYAREWRRRRKASA